MKEQKFNFVSHQFEVYDLPIFVRSLNQLKSDISKFRMSLDQIVGNIVSLNPEMYCGYSKEIDDYDGLSECGKVYSKLHIHESRSVF